MKKMKILVSLDPFILHWKSLVHIFYKQINPKKDGTKYSLISVLKVKTCY